MTATHDADGVQVASVTALAGERLSGVQRVQQYGFSARPPAGSTAVMLCIGGSRSHPVIIACDDPRTRFRELEPGESAQYNAEGDYIRLRASGEIEIRARLKVTVDAPLTHAKGDAEVDGDALVRGDVLIEGNATVAGNLAVAGAISAAGAISSATGVSAPVIADATGSMQGMRDVFNGHTQPVVNGVAQSPDVPMS